MTLRVAIVGAGPAGCYAAERLAAASPGIALDLYDRAAEPYGLIRRGVAPDHVGTKAVTRIFDRLFQRGTARFHGGHELGRTLDLDALRRSHDAVILATGAPHDRRLGIAGEDLANVVPSGRFAAWANGVDGSGPDLSTATHATVVGHGNVGLDVVRLLAKSAAELAAVPLADPVRAALSASRLSRIDWLGRGGPDAMKTSPELLAELARLERANVSCDGAPPPALAPILGRNPGAPVTIALRFGTTPRAFSGDGRVRNVVLDGAQATDLVVTAIGHRSESVCGLPHDGTALVNDGGRIAPGLWCIGWIARGPSGTIPQNRADAQALATRILAECSPWTGQPLPAHSRESGNPEPQARVRVAPGSPLSQG
ncbi:FAD-dependent oxidoreductase [Zavarzinia sp. CC-PAN008]|uniref:FAD-dependent oxidoreductase n=1 Tax=Zavarzinia sp. CC-PAN008 TaxID=3243332 RepID=UPI003F74A082